MADLYMPEKRIACYRCGGRDTDLVRVSNGAGYYISWHCHDCNAWAIKGPWLEKEQIGVPVEALTLWDFMESNNPGECEVCHKYGRRERHHFAPRALFKDAESWPTAMLCHDCHSKWHATVTPHLVRAAK